MEHPQSLEPKTFYNIHTHIFTEACVPSGFYGRTARSFIHQLTLLKSVREITVHVLNFLANFLGDFAILFNPLNRYDKGNSLARLIQLVTHDTQEEVLLEMMDSYAGHPRMKFVVLSLDMDFMQGGDALMNYPTQLYELINVKAKYEDKILPFLCIDPRRFSDRSVTADLKTFVTYFLGQKGFAGIKLYPALGFYPFDPVLFPLYELAEKHGIPIITHCDTGGIFYRGRLTEQHMCPAHLKDLEEARDKPRDTTGVEDGHLQDDNLDAKSSNPIKLRNSEFKNNFIHPARFREVLKIFPQLKLCFAHFGGAEEMRRSKNRTRTVIEPEKRSNSFGSTWFDEILILMDAYPNVYADISYTLHNDDLLPMITNTMNNTKYGKRVLFGTDFFLVSRERSETDLVTRFRTYVKEASFTKIASDNPKEFLRLNAPLDGAEMNLDARGEKTITPFGL